MCWCRTSSTSTWMAAIAVQVVVVKIYVKWQSSCPLFVFIYIKIITLNSIHQLAMLPTLHPRYNIPFPRPHSYCYFARAK